MHGLFAAVAVYCGRSAAQAVYTLCPTLQRFHLRNMVLLQAAEPDIKHGSHEVPAPRFYISGLQNASGQSCFFNAALQMLASSSRLMSHNVKSQFLQAQGSAPKLMRLLQSINAITLQKVSHSPEELLSTLAKSHAHLDGHSQQDSHEALLALLNEVHCDVAQVSLTGMPSPVSVRALPLLCR